MERAGASPGAGSRVATGQAGIRREPAACRGAATRSARAVGRRRGRQGV